MLTPLANEPSRVGRIVGETASRKERESPIILLHLGSSKQETEVGRDKEKVK